MEFHNDPSKKAIKLNWIRGLSPIYEVELSEFLKNPGYTICYYKTEESDFFAGEHISILAETHSEARNILNELIKLNGGERSFRTVDSDSNHYLGFLFDIQILEVEKIPHPIIEINRRKILKYVTTTSNTPSPHGIHDKSDVITEKIPGFNKLIYHEGEMVADGRFVADINGGNIKSYHGKFETAYLDVIEVVKENDPNNEILDFSPNELQLEIDSKGYSFNSKQFSMSCYKGNSSYWLAFNMK